MAKARKTGVLLVDDHLVVRMGIASIISFEDDLEVVGEAGDGVSALRAVEELRPDVIVMDVMMPGMDGAATTRGIMKSDPSAKVLLLTSFVHSPEVTAALSAGARGVVDKASSQAEILAAVRAVASGVKLVPEAVRSSIPAPGSTYRLTPRQRDIVELLVKGFGNREIGDILEISENTVKDALKKIYVELGVGSRAEATLVAVEQGLV